jgi:glycine oxidase
MSAPDVVFVGGGVIGLAGAWRAAAAGLGVAVVDPRPGAGASSAAAGMLAPVTEVRPGEELLLRLNRASAERYPAFVAELEDATGASVGYWRCGTVVAARDRDERAALEELFEFQRELGLPVERLDRKELRTLEPALAPSVSGGFFASGDHQVDNRALVSALVDACRRTGVELVARRAERVRLERGTAAGVVLDDGTSVASTTVVVSAGCWSRGLAGVPERARPPVRPVKGQLLHLRSADPATNLAHTVRGGDVYVVPRRDGRVVVGATVEEQGFDERATAGATFELLRSAYELIPGIVELELVETTVGLRPGSPDNAPILGHTSVEGLLVATGHYRSGILLAPVTADCLVELITTGVTPEAIAPFSPERFALTPA